MGPLLWIRIPKDYGNSNGKLRPIKGGVPRLGVPGIILEESSSEIHHVHIFAVGRNLLVFLDSVEPSYVFKWCYATPNSRKKVH